MEKSTLNDSVIWVDSGWLIHEGTSVINDSKLVRAAPTTPLDTVARPHLVCLSLFPVLFFHNT